MSIQKQIDKAERVEGLRYLGHAKIKYALAKETASAEIHRQIAERLREARGEFLEQVYSAKQDGARVADIASATGVGSQSVYNWLSEYRSDHAPEPEDQGASMRHEIAALRAKLEELTALTSEPAAVTADEPTRHDGSEPREDGDYWDLGHAQENTNGVKAEFVGAIPGGEYRDQIEYDGDPSLTSATITLRIANRRELTAAGPHSRRAEAEEKALQVKYGKLIEAFGPEWYWEPYVKGVWSRVYRGDNPGSPELIEYLRGRESEVAGRWMELQARREAVEADHAAAVRAKVKARVEAEGAKVEVDAEASYDPEARAEAERQALEEALMGGTEWDS